LVKEVLSVVRPMAMAFVNEEAEPSHPKHLRCDRIRPFRSLKQLAARDQVGELLEALKAQPDLLEDALEMAEILMEAAMRGKSGAVAALLDAGVDPNVPAPYKEGCVIQSLLVTPLCGAVAKGHVETVDLLKERGAV